MREADLSIAVARLLGWVFPRHPDAAFLDYLALTFGKRIAEPPRFETLCVMEAEYGDAQAGVIGGIMQRCWLADADGWRAACGRDLPRYVDDFNDAERTGRTYYRFPVVKFLREGTRLTFGEAFGPALACRKRGLVQSSQRGVAIVGVELLWNVESIMSGLPLPPVAAALDIDESRFAEPGAARRFPAR